MSFNFGKFLSAFSADVLKYAPYVIGMVVTVEQAMAGVPGETKRQVVVDTIVGVAKIGEQVPESHVSGIGQMVDTIVGVLNGAGVFTHGKPPVDAPTTIQVPALPLTATGGITFQGQKIGQ